LSLTCCTEERRESHSRRRHHDERGSGGGEEPADRDQRSRLHQPARRQPGLQDPGGLSEDERNRLLQFGGRERARLSRIV
jgi:hypothetical protein